MQLEPFIPGGLVAPLINLSQCFFLRFCHLERFWDLAGAFFFTVSAKTTQAVFKAAWKWKTVWKQNSNVRRGFHANGLEPVYLKLACFCFVAWDRQVAEGKASYLLSLLLEHNSANSCAGVWIIVPRKSRSLHNLPKVPWQRSSFKTRSCLGFLSSCRVCRTDNGAMKGRRKESSGSLKILKAK